MPIMGSDSQHRGQLPEPTQFPVRTPLSVAQLLSSRPTPADSVYHHAGEAAAQHPVHPTVSRSSPPTPPALSASANPSDAAERRAWTAVNHTSPQVSPTTNKLPPIISDFTNQPAQSLPQSAVLSFHPASTSEASRSPQDVVRSLTPINNHRQDSAIFQRPIETSKEAHAFGPSPDLTSYHSHRSPNHSQRSLSPRSSSYPTTPSSPQPSQQNHSQSGMQAQGKGYSTSRPVTNQRSPVSIDNDHSTTNNSRQQRYNVRFNQIYTSDNMPPSQKPRNDPSSTATASTEHIEQEPKTPDRPTTPTAIPSRLPVLPPTDNQPQTQQRQDPSVLRCEVCNEAWKRPLPGRIRTGSPAEDNQGIARNSMDLIAQLRNHSAQADLAYERWCYKHRFCIPPEGYEKPPSPPITEPQIDPHSTNGDGPRQDDRNNDGPINNKRKSDLPHDSDRQANPKSRKVTFKT